MAERCGRPRLRRLVAVLALAAPLALGGGVALAATIDCGTDPAVDCYGTARPDTILGSQEVDGIHGRGSGDALWGNGGNDGVYGGDGDDTLGGNAGDDELVGHPGNDLLVGGAGNDEISADGDPGYVDTINCGKGKRDTVYFDQGVDIVSKNCERKFPQ